MNPFLEKAADAEEYLEPVQKLYPKAYDKNEVDPYTKTRIILACGAEFEANWFSHQLQRTTEDNDLRRQLAFLRFLEKEQQQKIANLKPIDETFLETTISYEQLAVDLTAELAQKEKNFSVKKALDFALLEDFDHLYRYSDLLENDEGIHAETLVGNYTEIMPARPTVSHHRHPYDNVKKPVDSTKDDTQTVLCTMIITAAEQQTMNFYMNGSATYQNDAGRKLYEEIALVEEEHVTQYGSLIDASADPLACLLWHEFTECYLYWSNYNTETDKRIKKLWEFYFETELSHLHAVRKIVKKKLKKDYDEIIKDPVFPEPLSLHENIAYVRDILSSTVQFTGDLEDYKNVSDVGEKDRYFAYRGKFCAPISGMPSHKVIKDYISARGKDYRFETDVHPIGALKSRTTDNVKVGFDPSEAKSTRFKAN